MKTIFIITLLWLSNVFSNETNSYYDFEAYNDDIDYLVKISESNSLPKNKVFLMLEYLKSEVFEKSILGSFFITNLYQNNLFPASEKQTVLEAILKRLDFEINNPYFADLELIYILSIPYALIGNNDVLNIINVYANQTSPSEQIKFETINIEKNEMFNDNSYLYKFFAIHALGLIHTNEAMDLLSELIKSYEINREVFFKNLSVCYLMANYKNKKAFEQTRDLEAEGFIRMGQYQAVIDANLNDLIYEELIPTLAIDSAFIGLGLLIAPNVLFLKFFKFISKSLETLRLPMYRLLTKQYSKKLAIKILKPKYGLVMESGTYKNCQILKVLKNGHIEVLVKNTKTKIVPINEVFPSFDPKFYKMNDLLLVPTEKGTYQAIKVQNIRPDGVIEYFNTTGNGCKKIFTFKIKDPNDIFLNAKLNKYLNYIF